MFSLLDPTHAPFYTLQGSYGLVVVILLDKISELATGNSESRWILLILLMKCVQIATSRLTIIGLGLILEYLMLLDHGQIALSCPLGLQGGSLLLWQFICPYLFELEKRIEVGPVVENSAARLELLRRLVTIAVAHFGTVLDGTALGRTVLLSVLQELQHNKIISIYPLMHKVRKSHRDEV